MTTTKVKEGKQIDFIEEFVIGGVSGTISKTCAAPMERVKLILQNQHELIRLGRLQGDPYTSIVECFLATLRRDGVIAMWQGNLANVIRYFPTQAFNFAFKDYFNKLFSVDRERDGYMKWCMANMAAGALAGTSSLTITYPLDYIRTRLGNDVSFKNERQFNGIRDCVQKTYQANGVAGLYRGFSVSAFAISIYRGCYFGFYDSAKPFNPYPQSFVSNFMFGWCATVAAGFIAYPMDTVCRRMMMSTTSTYTGGWHCLTDIIAKEGALSLMRGGGANVLRSVAGAGALAGADYIKPRYRQWKKRRQEEELREVSKRK
eukprot:PhF_6_TR33818/c0_g1_i1/m.49596/K05863/SLC25A4S, ANT; solute carrier family 25 (mitochondrial adenine nucleotide translocator), member 4/5/6/31